MASVRNQNEAGSDTDSVGATQYPVFQCPGVEVLDHHAEETSTW